MATNLSMILLVLTLAFLGFTSIDEAEARALLPGSVQRASSLIIQEYSRPATSMLIPSPSSPYGPVNDIKSSLTNTDDDIDGTTTMVSKATISAAPQQTITPQILNNDSRRSRNSRPAKSPPPPPNSPYGPSPCRGSVLITNSHSSIQDIPANCVTSPVLVDSI